MNMGRLVDTLIRHEGSVKRGDRHFPYKDSTSHLTIGYGRNLTDNGISEGEARTLFLNDIQGVLNGIRRQFNWFEQLNEVRQEVIVNMVFNLGLVGFSKFKNTITAIKAGAFHEAADRMLHSKWATQVKGRAVELSEMMRSGEMQDDREYPDIMELPVQVDVSEDAMKIIKRVRADLDELEALYTR